MHNFMTALFGAIEGSELAPILGVYHMVNFNIFFIKELSLLWSEIG